MKALTFTSAHEEMHRNYEAKNWARRDWGCSGTSYSRPHWRPDGRTVPISHTRGEHIRLQVQLRIRNSEICGQLIGEPVDSVVEASGAFRFASEVRTLGEETHLIEVVGQNPLPAWPQRITQKIQWRFQRQDGQSTALEASGPHTVFVTFGPPVDTQTYEEQGATRRRMMLATHLVSQVSQRQAPYLKCIERLFKVLRPFVLGPEQLSGELRGEWEQNRELRKYMDKVDWPSFMHYKRPDKEQRLKKQGGAWPLASIHRYKGECQAIVRFTRGILHQVGFREGTVDARYLTADFRTPEHALVKETSMGCSGPKERNRQYALISESVQQGTEGTAVRLGANQYEAVMRYRYEQNGTWYQVWFGGGIGCLNDDPWPESNGDISQEKKDILLKSIFRGIAKCECVGKENGMDKYRIVDYQSYRTQSRGI